MAHRQFGEAQLFPELRQLIAFLGIEIGRRERALYPLNVSDQVSILEYYLIFSLQSHLLLEIASILLRPS
jgi:hypothetical protein